MILSPPSERIVTDYEFHFTSGRFLGVVVDHKLGDEIVENDFYIKIRLGARPEMAGADALPAEELEIQRGAVAYTVKRDRTFVEPTKEQRDEMARLIGEGSKLTH